MDTRPVRKKSEVMAHPGTNLIYSGLQNAEIRKIFKRHFVNIYPIDTCSGRTLVTPGNHERSLLLRTFQKSFDRTIAAIPDTSGQAQFSGLLQCMLSEKDALYPSMYD